ncbi:thermonuclease family protein [Candidatus Gottesmanbacteria bacterium]|nr:thermonuclease family protein [Candidatus Gottesmanbacteria bacterium]
MAKRKAERWDRKRLLALGIPAVLIPGLAAAVLLGWNPTKLETAKNYQAIKTIFPTSGVVTHVGDGDTFELKNGVEVRMIGINAPDRGEVKWKEAGKELELLVLHRKVYLEYDRYQDDKYGRVLAWVWEGCEKEPTFLPADYMHLSGNESRKGLLENPEGCTQGNLINEEMVKKGFASSTRYKERGELKYERRLQAIEVLK